MVRAFIANEMCGKPCAGSNPVRSAVFGVMAELDIAPVLKTGLPARVCRFESC